MKDALKNDRARIQVGRISHFGLLEMSRQRIRTGVLEGSTVLCPHCLGAGVVRSTSSVALHVLRVLEDALIKSAAHDMTVRARTPVALYILNQKRAHLRDLERRFGVAVLVEADDSLTGVELSRARARRTRHRDQGARQRTREPSRRLRRFARRRGLRGRRDRRRPRKRSKSSRPGRKRTNSRAKARLKARAAKTSGRGWRSQPPAPAATAAARRRTPRRRNHFRRRAAADRRRPRGRRRNRRRFCDAHQQQRWGRGRPGQWLAPPPLAPRTPRRA